MRAEEIVGIKARVEKDLLGQPGVTGVGVGYKRVKGKKTEEIAIVVYVEKKKPTSKIPENERIPKKIDGATTDVIERTFELKQRLVRVDDLVLRADTGTYDPLRGGISIGPCRSLFITGPDVVCQGVPGPGNYIFVGTLGAFVRDNVSNAEMMLSNFHVMALDNNWSVGDTIAQPSLVDGGNCPADVVGALQRASIGGQVDCAVASHTARGFSCDIVDIGDVAGQATATLGMAVRKRGRTTGLTYGTVEDIALTVTLDYCNGLGNVTLTNQIGIDVDTSQSTQFGDGGDSGSVVVDGSRNVVGLYFAGNQDGTYGVANPIAAVLTALNVSLCVPAPTTLKFLDDPITLKFLDDPRTLKFLDDPTLKFLDDPTLKFLDDPGTLKFYDDPGTLKFADDPGTLKFSDDPGGPATSPQLDPYKSPAYDKPPEMDRGGKPPVGDIGGQPPGLPTHAGAAPFVLATPHHSTAFTGQTPQQLQEQFTQLEQALRELERQLTEMHAAQQEGTGTPTQQEQLAAGTEQYRTLLAQYQQMASLQ